MRDPDSINTKNYCEIVNFEELVKEIARKHGLTNIPKHVDYMIICRDKVILVEETSEAKKEDFDKIDESIEFIRKYGLIKQNVDIRGIVHFKKGMNTLLKKHAVTRGYGFAGCEKNLFVKINKLL